MNTLKFTSVLMLSIINIHSMLMKDMRKMHLLSAKKFAEFLNHLAGQLSKLKIKVLVIKQPMKNLSFICIR